MWKSFRHKLSTAGELSIGDWLVLGEAWWILLGFYLALRWLNFERLEAFTRTDVGKQPLMPDALAWAWKRQKLISLAAGLQLLAMTCLPRALCLRWMLSRAGIPSHLRIGMNKTSAGMYAHAWVEVAGENIGEPEDITERFKVLIPLEGRNTDQK